jgi:O-antigen ligase/polysaccharide polymerase Wzy-like membrane protein
LLGLAIVAGFGGAQPSAKLVVAGGLAAFAILALALARYETTVALAMLIFGVVYIEPAPPDIVLMIVIAVAIVTGRFSLRRVPLALVALLAAFIVLNLVSTIFATLPGRAAFFLAVTVYLCVFAIWMIGFVDSEHRARVVVVPMIVGAVVTTAMALVLQFTTLPLSSQLSSEHLRLRGFFKDPNVFGPFCVFIVLLILAELVEPRLIKGRRTLKLVSLLIMALGVLFASSRAAWLNAAIALLAMVAAYSLRRGGSRKSVPILITLVVIAGIGSITLAATGSAGFLSSRAHIQHYDTQRFAAQEKGIHIAEHYPLGIGPGQFENTVGISAHEAFVRVLAEQGVLGLVVMLALMLTTLGLAARNVVQGRDTFGIGSVPLFAAWCGILVNGAFVDTLHWRHFWLVIALIWAGATQPSVASWTRR